MLILLIPKPNIVSFGLSVIIGIAFKISQMRFYSLLTGYTEQKNRPQYEKKQATTSQALRVWKFKLGNQIPTCLNHKIKSEICSGKRLVNSHFFLKQLVFVALL